MRSAVPVVLVVVGCGGPVSEERPDVYVPFDEARVASQVARLEAFAGISALTDEVTVDNHAQKYEEIEAAYQADGFQASVADLTDGHLDTVGYGVAGVGAFLDLQIADAIEVGKASTDEVELAVTGEVVAKALLVSFYHCSYQQLSLRGRGALDEAFGCSGLAADGTAGAGLATVAAGRETEFGVTILRPTLEAFIDARIAMALGTEVDSDRLAATVGEYDDAMAEIDRHLLRTMAYYAIHERDEYDEGPAVKLAEARVIWDGVAAFAAETDPATAADIVDGLYPDGVGSRAEGGYFLSGLDAVIADPSVIDVSAVRADISAILLTLE